MKVVGGPCDGCDIWIGEGKMHINLADPIVRHRDRKTANPLQTWTNYSVRTIRCPRNPSVSDIDGVQVASPQFDELKFLAPAEWSDFKAIHWQFTK